MDPISFTASLLTLLETATGLGKAAITLHRDLHGASHELQWVSSRILQTRSQLGLLLRIYERQCKTPRKDGSVLLPEEDLAPLQTSLAKGRECLEEIERAVGGDSGKLKCVQWALRDKRLVMKLLERLRDVESGLSMLLLAIAVSISSSSYTSIIDIASRQDAFFQSVCQNKGPQQINTSKLLVMRWSDSPPTHASTPRVWRRSPVLDSPTAQPISSSIVLNAHWNQLRSTYSISCLLRLPFMLSRYTIEVRAGIQCFTASLPSFFYSIGLKNIIPSDSRFMKACEGGDLETVREMMILGGGSPTDLDEFGKSALHRAIMSQSSDLVKFLLDNGAYASIVDERCQESALELACRRGLIDIGRLLLVKGACVEHVDLGGGTALANLWMNPNLSFSRIDFARALFAVSPPPLHPNNGEFINPLNCVAMTGSGEEIEFLMGLGANPSRSDGRGDFAMKYCIWGSNPSTYDRIEPWMPLGWIDQTDDRGRNPLHKALEFPGCNTAQIVERLLKAGADIHARDLEGNSPEDIARSTDFRFKDQNVWKIGKCRNFEAYLQALESCGFNVEIDNDGDLFWLASDNAQHGSEVEPDKGAKSDARGLRG